MKLIKTKISGPLIIKTKIYKDKRGFLKETFRNNCLKISNFHLTLCRFQQKKC